MGANVTEKRLTARQVRALGVLSSGTGAVPEAAQAANVAPKTVYSWLRLAPFMAELRRLQAEALRNTARQLTNLGDDANTAVKEALDPAQPMGIRLRAAALVYDRGPALLELADFEERLRAIEARLDERGHV